MSIELQTEVWKHADLSGTKLLLLLALADYADDEHRCFPKVKTLAARIRTDERGTRKHLKELRNLGYISVLDQSNGRRSNVYQVNPKPCQNNQGETTRVKQPGSKHHGSRDRVNPGQNDTPPNLYNEPPIEPSIVPPTPKGKASRIRSLEWDQEFDIFWNLCPKKKSKEQARKAWHKMRRNKSCTMPPEEVAELYRKHYDSQRDAQYAQHPGTWLNAMGYEDEEPEQQQQPAATDPKGRPLPPGFTWDNELYGIRNQFGYQVGEDMVEQEWRKLGNEEKAQKWVHVEPNWEMVP